MTGRPADSRPDQLTTYGRGRAVRWTEYDYVGDALVHVTICADRGRPFQNAVLAEITGRAIERTSEILHYRLFGYCVMLDHAHVLLSPAESGVEIARWLRRFKSYTGHEFARLGGTPPLWQRSAFDHVCREGETAEEVLTYIVNNPVRVGLIECWQDWPWTKVCIEI